uniref:Protein FAR1-RELATED SEQUENCE 5 n=1 Tax=Lygus hesperus TaxID=30085 RepID=A0A0A9YMD7_LYGHE
MWHPIHVRRNLELLAVRVSHGNLPRPSIFYTIDRAECDDLCIKPTRALGFLVGTFYWLNPWSILDFVHLNPCIVWQLCVLCTVVTAMSSRSSLYKVIKSTGFATLALLNDSHLLLTSLLPLGNLLSVHCYASCKGNVG